MCIDDICGWAGALRVLQQREAFSAVALHFKKEIKLYNRRSLASNKDWHYRGNQTSNMTSSVPSAERERESGKRERAREKKEKGE